VSRRLLTLPHYGNNPAALLNSGQFESNYLVIRKEISGRMAEITYDLGKRGGATMPKTRDAYRDLPSQRGVFTGLY
jgi:hypothetical protein